MLIHMAEWRRGRRLMDMYLQIARAAAARDYVLAIGLVHGMLWVLTEDQDFAQKNSEQFEWLLNVAIDIQSAAEGLIADTLVNRARALHATYCCTAAPKQ